MNLFVGGGVLLQDIPEQAFEILLADALAGVFGRAKIEPDIQSVRSTAWGQKLYVI